MSGTQPVGLYAMKVPPGDIMVPGCPGFAAMFRVSMAAIDPSAEPEIQDTDDKHPPRATLKVVRFPIEMFDDSSEEEDEDDEALQTLLNGMGDDESSEDDEVNGGPSNSTAKPRKTLEEMAAQSSDEDEDMDSDEKNEEKAAEQAEAVLTKIMKGKDKAVQGEESDSDVEDENLGMDETVVCTLDPEKHYQQPLDIVVGEDERIFFKVTGTHTIHLTGNFVIPVDDGRASLYDDDEEDEEDEEDEYDLSPDEEVVELDVLDDEDEESDELDDLADPRITEVASEEEHMPKLAHPPTKGKNKRPAEDSVDEADEGETIDGLVAEALKKNVNAGSSANGEPKRLTKAEKRRLKKLKRNDGEEASAPVTNSAPVPPSSSSLSQEKKIEGKKGNPLLDGSSSEKKVQFAKNLEQGPTPSAPKLEPQQSKKPSTSLGIRDVQGVTVDDRKIGSGRQAKKGDQIEMRYIGKLEDGKVFDANKSGKAFAFKLGAGEVIKGWDIGMVGITVGGERRLTIPAHLAYGKKGSPPQIPSNTKLIFDVKCLSIK